MITNHHFVVILIHSTILNINMLRTTVAKKASGLFENVTDPWLVSIRNTVEKCKFKLKYSVTEDDLYVINIVGFQDALMIKSGLPRGFSVVLDKDSNLMGIGTFYPKFCNVTNVDQVWSRDTDNSYSFTIKYSGYLGIIVLVEVDGVVRYIPTSKNSCGDSTFVKDFDELISPLLTPDTLRSMWDDGIRSFSSEVMHKNDETHGYSYEQSFFVVTCAARYCDDGPQYLHPQELHDFTNKYKLVSDPPISVNGDFIEALEDNRDLLTYDTLVKIAKETNVDLATHHHLITSNYIEGFVVRVFDCDGVELPSIKYKCWLYVMTTMILRTLMKDTLMAKNTLVIDHPNFRDTVESMIRHWCTNIATVDKCRYLIYSAARIDVDTLLTSTSPWIVMTEKALEMYNWIDEMAEPLAPDTGRTIIIPIGIPGVGKTSTLMGLRETLKKMDKRVVYATQDSYSSFKPFAKALDQPNDLSKHNDRLYIIADRNNVDESQRKTVTMSLVKPGDEVLYVDFVGGDAKSIKDIALERALARGLGHDKIKSEKSAKMAITMFVNKYTPVDASVNDVIYLDINDSVESKVLTLLSELGIDDGPPKMDYEAMILRQQSYLQRRTKVLYDEIKLTDDSVRLLIEEYKQLFDTPHGVQFHVTLEYYNKSTKNASMKQTSIEKYIGEEVELRPMGYVYDDNCNALMVDVIGDVPHKDFTHITMWCKAGTNPVYANTLSSRMDDIIETHLPILKGEVHRNYA